VSDKVTRIHPAEGSDREPAVVAIVAGDESGLRRLAELLTPYLPVPGAAPSEPDRWLSTRWFKRADIDAWRRGERAGASGRRAA
jgi:hypothetical protein